MEDRALVGRLGALLESLKRVSDELEERTWVPEEPVVDTRFEMRDKVLWVGLETTLIMKIGKIREDLSKVREKVIRPEARADDTALSGAWTEYAKILEESRGILQESLEVIGTLAIRNKDLDKRILYVADELIRSCLTLTTGDLNRYLTTHGMEGTFTKTNARIIRLRFPDWTLWDLPLVAHELGHVLISQKRDEEFEPFLEKQRDSLVAQDSKLSETKEWAKARVHELMADAFAAYTMGPAYASSAILLRLDPAVNAKEGRPSHGQRAYVILKMLEWMNATKDKLTRPLSAVIDLLRTDWDSLMKHVNPGGKLSGADEMWLQQLVQALGDEIWKNALRRTAMYPLTGDREGWTGANSLAEDWLKQLKESKDPKCPDNFSGNMRDVLNAAWLCRLQIEGSLEEQALKFDKLAEVGQVLCHKIIDATSPSVGGPRSNARGAR